MGKRIPLGLVLIFLLLTTPVWLRRTSIPISSNGEKVAVARRPSVFAWQDNKVEVYGGGSNKFSLLGDIWSFPLFIYAFPDCQRFLCVYDDDVDIAVFIVDFRPNASNTAYPRDWPPNDYVKNCLAQRATNIVVTRTGSVRLPSLEEVQAVSQALAALTSTQLKTACFPCADFGVYRFYWPREALLGALATNRQSIWP